MASLRILLTQGRYAVVDESDYKYLSQWKWYYGTGYACRTEFGTQKNGANGNKIFMHRQIMNFPKHLQVDHRNRDGLDNRRINLRVATPSQNQWNKGVNRNNTSGHKGINWCKQTNKWRVGINMKGKYLNLGRYSDIEEAAVVRKEAITKLHGEFARVK